MIAFVLWVATAAAQSCSGPFGIVPPDCCTCSRGQTAPTNLDPPPQCTNPCTQFCGCQCAVGFTGFIGGTLSGGNGLCTSAVIDPCGYNGNVPGTNAYATTDTECVCPQRCNFDGRSTLCSAHGVLPSDYILNEARCTLFSGVPCAYLEMDCFVGAGVGCVANIDSAYKATWGASTLGYCLCDPGYFGQVLTPVSSGSASAHIISNCGSRISQSFCSGQGRDITGPEYGTETCSANSGPPFFPTNGPLGENLSICGRRYISSGARDTSTFSPTCLCNPGFTGGSGTAQCSSTIRSVTCSGHGQDQCSSCRYPASATLAAACQCDVGWGPGLQGGHVQCGTFISCATYGCGTPPSPVGGYVPTLGGTCNPGDQVCTCSSGYGDIACCPLKFRATSIVCNGEGTCTSNGYCSCNPGWQSPGCCPQCDPSETCLVDGRCDCPVLGGMKCGGFSTGCIDGGLVSIGTHRQATLICQFQNATVQPRTGAFFSVSISGQFGCPSCGGGQCTSNAQPLDFNGTVTGSCVCNQDLPLGYNRTGSYCCPTAAGQHSPCSGGLNGYCNPLTAACVCDPGVFGLACETNTQCNPSLSSQCPGGRCAASTECSGNGQCIHNTGGVFGLGDYLAQLNYSSTCTSPYTTKDRVRVADCGLVVFMQTVYSAFFGLDPTAVPGGVPESFYYPVSVCNGTRGQCLFSLLVAMQNLPAGTPLVNTLCSRMQQDPQFVLDSFNRLHPTRLLLQGTYFNQLLSAFSCSSLATVLAEGMASLVAWEVWNKLYRTSSEAPPDTTSFTVNPSLPSTNPGSEWQCQCPPGVGGSQCELTGCPVGSNGLTCSGFVNGQLQGLCTGSNQCECSAAWGCPACDCPRSPGCFPLGGTGLTLCSSNGNCVLNSTSRSFQCQCQPQFTGTYCDLSRCQPPGIAPNTNVCNNNKGVCTANLVCDCSSYLASPAFVKSLAAPFLPVGNACEVNATAQCATFASGVGWQVCSGNGICAYNYTTQNASCQCAPGTGGTFCELSPCTPLCNSHQICNTNAGTCGCEKWWGTPATGCTSGNRTCECGINLCGAHGTPSASDGSVCICDPGWKHALDGSCTVVQCPTTVYTTQGVIPCPVGTPSCTDPSSISQSLSQGCCVDTCPSCSLSNNGTTRTCQCGSLSGGSPCYTQISGICFPNCHGSDALVPNNPPNCDSTTNPGTLICHCDWLVLQPNQFRDLRCQVYTCLNGGLPFAKLCNPLTEQCCDCSQTAYTGPFCAVSACGSLGTPNGTVCACYPPYTRSPMSQPLCNANTCGTGGLVTGTSPATYQCSCPGNLLPVPGGLSCRPLNCTGQDAQACSVCLHGSTPILINQQVVCNCAGTNYTDLTCSTPVCRNGGSVLDGVCQCTPPFTSDAFCSTAVCFNGATVNSNKTGCDCPIEWTGTQCQIASGIAAPVGPQSSSTGSSSSSSSTGIFAPSSSSSGSLSGGVIAGIVVGTIGGLGLLIGLSVYLTQGATAAVKTSLAAAAASQTAASQQQQQSVNEEEMRRLLPGAL